MSFPTTFDAYVPSNGADFFSVAKFKADYVPFDVLRAVSIDSVEQLATFAYSKRITPLSVVYHSLRCFYFALALLYTGFPSGTPGVPQIGFEELSLRLYHTALLHDLAWGNTTESTQHPAHAMTFELHGGFMAYEHLHAEAPSLNADQVGDIVQSIVLHTSQWPSGNSSAVQFLMSVTAFFDVGGYNGTGIGALNDSLIFHPKTVQDIERVYPRGSLYDAGRSEFDREFIQKPNCLLSHYPGGFDALLKDLRVGPIVPGNSSTQGLGGLD
ncbi:hypothetical protein MVEN_02513100 [Mycena venus]|uniref:HD domain-containing protein n=1 Tax=Mycena venus TaxID=2733690 RepID=A0A8H6U4J5_9AGAR|nr:hypothetical protein MVEN_02513100 [Mycena venus]